MKQSLGSVVRPLTGLVLCIVAAFILVFESVDHPWKGSVPIIFVVVIVLLAYRYGMFVSVIGSVASALLFAWMLFPPLGSFRVSSSAERANLAWMMLGSVAISYLLAPAAEREGKHDTQRVSRG